MNFICHHVASIARRFNPYSGIGASAEPQPPDRIESMVEVQDGGADDDAAVLSLL
ncbi:hypothetical protein ACFOSR_00270 [Aquamicrobium ahrensii]